MMTTKLKLEGYDNMIKWLEEHVGKVSDGVKSVEQSLQRQTFPGSFKLQQIESDGKSSKQEEYTFNANDINLNSLVFKVSGNSFGLRSVCSIASSRFRWFAMVLRNLCRRLDHLYQWRR